MPFGLNVAPRVFTKLMKPVIAWLRGQGVRMIIFLDDILLAPTVETMNQHARMTISLLESLGFLINYKKSTPLVPTQRILFLGKLIDSTTMEFILPTEKSENIQRECRNLLKTQQPSIRQISRVRTGGPWNIHESQEHINILELKATFFALKSFMKDQSNKVICLKIDNSTAVAYLNNKVPTPISYST